LIADAFGNQQSKIGEQGQFGSDRSGPYPDGGCYLAEIIGLVRVPKQESEHSPAVAPEKDVTQAHLLRSERHAGIVANFTTIVAFFATIVWFIATDLGATALATLQI
jgi:hypothetical protein